MIQNFKGIVKLSEENYITLSTTGTLTLKDGTVLTYDPTSTLYITPDDESTEGIPTLIGTIDTPINLYNDLDVNKLYLISGIIYNLDDNLIANDSILSYKTNTNSLYLIGGKIDLLTNELTFKPNYFTVAEIEATGEISTHQTSIAPVNSGILGQVLVSNGPDEAPTWQNLSTTDGNTAASLTSGSAELNFSEVEGTPDYAALTCNKPLFIGQPDKDLYLDADLMHGFFESG